MRTTAQDLPLPVDPALSRASVTCLAAMILEQPSPRLHSVACDPGRLGLRLLNQPLVAYQLALLRHHGVTRVVRTAPNGATLAMPDVALNGDTDAGGTVLLVDGNVLTNADVSAMLRFHAEHSPAATVLIAQHRWPTPGSRGGIDAERQRQRFAMTPPSSNRALTRVDGGMYIVDAALLGALLSMPSVGRPQGFFALLHAEGFPCVGWYSPAYWRRIHTAAAYHAAHMDLLSGRVSMSLDPPGRATNGSWLGDGVTIGPEATIEPPSVIGVGTEIGARARVGPRAVVGAQTHLGPDVRVTESILGDGVVVGESAILDGCVVGDGARIGRFSILAPGAVLVGGTTLRSRTLLPR